VLVADREKANTERDQALRLLGEANAAFEQLQAELATPDVEAQPLVKIGGVSVGMASGDLDLLPNGEVRFNDTTGLIVQGDNYTIVADVQDGGSLNEGVFTGDLAGGTVSNGARVVEVLQGRLTARPGGRLTIKNIQSESSTGASSAE
jgi:hypothetical protein